MSAPPEALETTRRRSGARNIITVMGGTLASRVLGLVRQFLLNRYPTEVTDAFFVAFRIPNLFRELLAEGALTNSIIPIYKTLPPQERKAFAGAFAGVLAAVNLVVVGVGIAVAPWVVGIRLESGGSVNFEMAVMLTRIMWPFLTGISFSALAMALLNAEERFAATSFSPLAFSVISIAGFLLLPRHAVELGWITTAAGFAQLLVQVPALRRYGLLPRPRLAWTPPVARAFTLMLPFSLTTGTRELLNIVLTFILSGFAQGAQTGFANADAIFQLGLGLFAVSPALASYPRLAEFAARNDWDAFRDTVAQYARLVLFFCAPVAALLFALAPSVVSGLYDWRGLLAADKYQYTVLGVPPLALAIVPWGLNQFFVRSFYVRQRVMEAIAINAVGFTINTALYFALSRAGYVALNYATTVTGFLMVGVYIFLLNRKVPLPLASLAGFALRVVVAAASAGALAWLVARLLPAGRGAGLAWVRLVLGGGLGGGAYLALAVLFGLPELRGVARRLLRR